MPRIVDASVFLTLVLCHVDAMTYVETPQGISLRFDGDQFRRHLAELQARAAQLPGPWRASLPPAKPSIPNQTHNKET
jgi:hypothetical protein